MGGEAFMQAPHTLRLLVTQPVHMHLFPTTFYQIPHYNTWKASGIPQNLLLFVWAVLGFGVHQWPGSAGAGDTVSALY